MLSPMWPHDYAKEDYTFIGWAEGCDLWIDNYAERHPGVFVCYGPGSADFCRVQSDGEVAWREDWVAQCGGSEQEAERRAEAIRAFADLFAPGWRGAPVDA